MENDKGGTLRQGRRETLKELIFGVQRLLIVHHMHKTEGIGGKAEKGSGLPEGREGCRVSELALAYCAVVSTSLSPTKGQCASLTPVSCTLCLAEATRLKAERRPHDTPIGPAPSPKAPGSSSAPSTRSCPHTLRTSTDTQHWTRSLVGEPDHSWGA